jgi:hypothetical protein
MMKEDVYETLAMFYAAVGTYIDRPTTVNVGLLVIAAGEYRDAVSDHEDAVSGYDDAEPCADCDDVEDLPPGNYRLNCGRHL